jgi:hypothetical protein
MTGRCLTLVALLAVPAAAQTTTVPAPTSEPDIAIFATVRADHLLFEEVPKVTVTFPGDPRNQNVWKSDRENLPEQVQPRVLYRNIGIHLTITSTLPDIEQILDEALGTVPVTTPTSQPPRARAKATPKRQKRQLQ